MLGNKARPRRLNSKGNLNGNNSNTLLSLSPRSLHLDTVASRFGRALCKSIPVLSIFALVGIVTLALVCTDNLANVILGNDEVYAAIIDPSTACDLPNGGMGYIDPITQQCINLDNPDCGSGYIWDSTAKQCNVDPNVATASITISGNGREEEISAGRGSTIYRTHSISITGSNVRNYTLSIYGDSNLKYVGSGSDILTSAGGKAGSSLATNTWGYGYGDSTTNNDSLTYKAPTGSTIGTAETLASGTVASSANGVLSISNKKLVFAAKFDEDKPSGNYRANVNLALTITPRVLTTYSITYNGNGNTGGTVPAKQSIDLYDTTSYTFIAAANTGNLTKTGYNFLGWSESSTATTAAYTAGSSTVSLTSSKPEITLYAVWKKAGPSATGFGGIKKMQDMTADICSKVSTGTSGQLYDDRDGSAYTVAKLANGSCWMTQNLRLAGGTAMTSNNTDLNGISSYTLPAATDGAFSDTRTNNTYENQQVRNSSNDTYGAYYSWCAATAGTCMTNNTTPVPANTDASSSICPKGWKLPKGGSNGDFQALYNKGTAKVGDFTNGSTTSGYWLGASTANSANAAFFPAAGSVSPSGLDRTGSYGYYWSRTAYSTIYAYYLYFKSSDVRPAANNYRYFGVSVRCVAYSS